MRVTKLLVILAVLFATKMAYSADTVIINQPNGGQTVCIVQGAYVVCY